NRIYVGSGVDGAAFPGGIWVIDGVANTAVAADMTQIPQTSSTPGQLTTRDIAVVPASGRVYFRIIGGSTQTLGVLNAATNVATAVDNSPYNILRVNPVLSRVYAGIQATGQPNQLIVYDDAAQQVLATLTVGSPSPFN